MQASSLNTGATTNNSEVAAVYTSINPNRSKRTTEQTLPEQMLSEVAEALKQGDYLGALDLYELTMDRYPQYQTEILAAAYQLYKSLRFEDRYQLYQSRLFDFKIAAGSRVLDVGSGNHPFPLATELAELAVNDNNYGRAGQPFINPQGLVVHECNIEQMPFHDKEFDFVYCAHVLEHVHSPERACDELMRVAKRGFLETPNKGKDLWLNTAKISNHIWSVEIFDQKLVFTEYDPYELDGLKCNLMLDMHCNPQSIREQAFSALQNLKANLFNCMLLWDGEFEYEVRRRKAKIQQVQVNYLGRPECNKIKQSDVAIVGNVELVNTKQEKTKLVVAEKTFAPFIQNSPSCIFLGTYYSGFLAEIYRANPGLDGCKYSKQLELLQAAGFGDSDFYSENLKAQNWQSIDLISNCAPLQRAWVAEYSSINSLDKVYLDQIRAAKADVVYVQDMHSMNRDLLVEIKKSCKLLVGQIASPILSDIAIEQYDIIVSSFPHYVKKFREQGIAAYYQPLAFDERMLSNLSKQPSSKRPIQLSFVGGISGDHTKRTEFLEFLANNSPLEIWGYGVENCAANSVIRQRHRGEVWGVKLFDTLSLSRITVNSHIDAAENNANNMRLFEATGSGALLITDYKDNLSQLFKIGEEVVAYRSPEECLALINYYLANPDQADRIAQAGQKRTLETHSYKLRMQQTAQILNNHLRRKYFLELKEPSAAAVITANNQAISKEDLSNELLCSWQQKEMATRQRHLVEQQLQQMYQGQVNPVFNVLASMIARITNEQSQILEAGCSSGYYYEVLEYLTNRKINYTGVDYSNAMIELAQSVYPQAKFYVSDAAKMPFQANAFDVVISSCVILHMPHYKQQLEESARLSSKYVILHRTPVSNDDTTRFFKESSYGVETLEIRFSESELLGIAKSLNLELTDRVVFDVSQPKNMQTVTYLFQKRS